MQTKYIFVTGGVVSGLGKGITAASLGRLLKARGLKVTVQKLDPYLNVDPGTMNPIQHGEVFVTDDGAETDLDLGHYERFIDENLSQKSNVTSGRVYNTVISNERNGHYAGQTIQVIPHITNEIKRVVALNKDADVVFVEIGGTIGDIEGLPFIEAIRQYASEVGRENCLFIHVTLLPFIAASMELKTKPTQHSVKELLSIGIQPDIIVCRTERPITEDIKQKIALFCNVKEECVIENRDLDLLYEIPMELERQGLAKIAIQRLGIECGELDMTDWNKMVDRLRGATRKVTVALVGKYIELHDSYLSVVEALTHGGIEACANVEVKWIRAEDVTEETAPELFADVQGILVPGGFGYRGVEGKIAATKYAREHAIPYLGICLGMQAAIIEFSRNVLGLSDANSTEFDANTTNPVIDLMSEQKDISKMGGTMRLGQYPCALDVKSKAYEAYQQELIYERHRHRYEVNNDFREQLEKGGLLLSGISPDKRIVEMVELKDHPWFVAVQFHPEFKSRPNRAHPLFVGLVRAALEQETETE